MGAMLPLVVLGSMVVGGILIWLGMLGRRINRNPQCTWCRFDLNGVYPGVVTCPECGAGLKRAKAVRMGVRKRMPVVVAVGGLMVVAPMLAIGAIVYSLISGSALNARKPAWLLMTEARVLGDTHAATVAKELLDRMVTKKMAKEDSERAIALALDIQGDRNRQWSDAWGEIIDRGEVDKVLTDEQRNLYRKQSLEFGLRTREEVVAGDPLPVFLSGKEFRLSPAATMQVSAWVVSVKVNGVECPRRIISSSDYLRYGMGARPYSKFDPVAVLYVGGSRSGWGYAYANGSKESTWVGWTHVLPETVGEGPAVVEVEVVVKPDAYGNFGRVGGLTRMMATENAVPKPGEDGAFALKMSTRLKVGAKDSRTISVQTASSSVDEQLKLRLRPSTVTVRINEYESGGASLMGFQITRGGKTKTYYASVQLDVKDLPAELSHDVYMRLPGKKERLIGQMISDHVVADRGYYSTWSWGQNQDARSLGLSLNEEDMKAAPTKLDLIFKPRGEWVKLAATQRRFYEGTILVKDVPIVIEDYTNGRGGVPRTTVDEKKSEDEKKKEQEEEKR
ncbi:MAG: hypothetical protein IBJ18_13740 [Phycisphaerales bacterium]|nr:hypothetical protein [Phycisphaerales bacterium]